MPTLNELTDLEIKLKRMFDEDEIDEQTFEDTISSLGKEEKIDGLYAVATDLQETIDILTARIKNNQERLKSEKKSLDNLLGYVVFVMEKAGVKELRTHTSLFKTRKSVAVDIDDETAVIPEEFIDIKETRTPNKTKLKAFINGGGKVKGVAVVERTHAQVK
ncbi:siphovirus Gp157 family protein [Leuconostoc lactis]